MAWHIFRKDWRLMWPLAVGTAVLQAWILILTTHSTPLPLPEATSMFASIVTLVLAIAMTLLIVLSIQQESIPSISQDWLTRPVERGDLLLGKLLTIALLIHGPIFAVNILQGLMEGFSLGPVLLAALHSNFEIALCYSLPVMVIAATTRGVVEAIVFGLIVLVITLCAGVARPTASGTGLVWIWRSFAHAELLLLTIVALGWQYLKRSRDGTRQAQSLFLVGVLLSAWTPLLPWGPAFAIQRGLAATPGASRPIAIAVERGNAEPARWILGDATQVPPNKGFERVIVPLRFSGVPGDVIVHVDRAKIRLVSGDGTLLFSGQVPTFDLTAHGARTVQQAFDLSSAFYAQHRGQSLRLELNYFGSLMRGKTVPTPVPLNDVLRVPEFGWCATRGDTTVELSCRQIGALPFCISLAVGQMPEKFVCELNYEPVPLRFSVDPIDHVKVTLPRPGAGDTGVTIRVYEPVDYFSRQVAIADFRLQDWAIPAGSGKP